MLLIHLQLSYRNNSCPSSQHLLVKSQDTIKADTPEVRNQMIGLFMLTELISNFTALLSLANAPKAKKRDATTSQRRRILIFLGKVWSHFWPCHSN